MIEVIRLFLVVVYLISGIFVVLLLSSIFSLILTKSFLSKVAIYKLFVLFIDFIQDNIITILTMGKLFILYKMLHKTISRIISFYNLQVKKYLVIL